MVGFCKRILNWYNFIYFFLFLLIFLGKKRVNKKIFFFFLILIVFFIRYFVNYLNDLYGIDYNYD